MGLEGAFLSAGREGGREGWGQRELSSQLGGREGGRDGVRGRFHLTALAVSSTRASLPG